MATYEKTLCIQSPPPRQPPSSNADNVDVAANIATFSLLHLDIMSLLKKETSRPPTLEAYEALSSRPT